MEENEVINLDSEYKRYLKIMRPYLGQLLSEDAIKVCKAWIQRLSNCKENEKFLRNRYVFTLCYQLAKGILGEPFTRFPSENDLKPLCDDSDSDESSTEIECLVIDPENEQIKTLYNSQKTQLSGTENISSIITLSENNIKETSKTSYNSTSLANRKNRERKIDKCSICFANTDVINEIPFNNEDFNEKLEYRANNVLQKLRQMKEENIMLHREIMLLKEESKLNDNCYDQHEHTLKVDNTTSTHFHTVSNTALNSLKCKLQEVQHSSNVLLESLSNLQDKLDHYDELKRHEIEEIQAKHKLEIIQLKSSVREDTLKVCEKNIVNIKLHYENIIKDIEHKMHIEMEKYQTKINEILEEKQKLDESKEEEICRLNSYIENIKSQLSTQMNCSDKNLQSDRANELEKRLHKLEKSRNKNTRAYETRIANLQREKHLTECSLQLQLIKQRAQVVSEITDENQTDLTVALEKLEGKYKEIIGNVQATAVQRRIQDQMALETLIKTICDIPQGGLAKDNKIFHQDTLIGDHVTANCNTLSKGGPVIVGNKSFGEESVANSYFLNNEKLEELIGKIHIPQKDTNNDHFKKP